ncbi:helix-turn-helix domain-containing protein [Mycobacterium intracellulare]|uniref:helix-turn-helix domain-containing protein n=1 Tax=Mycobacterium intracellulare TaxID=1767 RepID=UPI001EEDEA41|nr:helix-turn-helix domain-containing protein [Mycobacterium intracellulare]MEE3755230.1 helix-turn-helix domain-containing protein [Mycobacterium intracellulare]
MSGTPTWSYNPAPLDGGMTLETSPQPGRPVMTARQAARTLRLDVRTVRRMIERGELAGGAEQGPKQQRWYVYADQLTPSAGDKPSADDRASVLASEVRRLQAANTDLTAKLQASEEINRILLAAQATQREAFAIRNKAVDEILSGIAGYRTAAEHFERATTGLQATASLLTGVVDSYGEALVQYGYDGDPRALTNSPDTDRD